MPWHFDFGHDGDVAFCGVLDDFFGVLLGVEASVGFVFVLGGRIFEHGLATGGAYGGELWILFDFQAPALVFGEVPVEDVELVECEGIDVLLDCLFWHEVSTVVEHGTSPGESGDVFDDDGGHDELFG